VNRYRHKTRAGYTAFVASSSFEETKVMLQQSLGRAHFNRRDGGDLVQPWHEGFARQLLRGAVSRGDVCIAPGMSAAIVDEFGNMWAGDVIKLANGTGLRVWGRNVTLRGRLLRLGWHSWATRHACWVSQHKGIPLLTLTDAAKNP
jgi:hypothetical protein